MKFCNSYQSLNRLRSACCIILQHTSASLTINENADPTVRMDMESHFNHFVPERQSYYRHDYEGDDDMPAHIKSSTLGCELTLPIANGELQQALARSVLRRAPRPRRRQTTDSHFARSAILVAHPGRNVTKQLIGDSACTAGYLFHR